ncbi:MAG: glycosyltransferase family 4 protein [Caldilineaceae bacterium]|nr:glycosyltransferase family 4 protein [Caldilineaceae bacterium]
MRIFVLSNFYPPHVIGGMEQRCKEAVDHLRSRGYQVWVLTSRYGADATPDPADYDVFRLLTLESDLVRYRPLHFFQRWPQEERENLAHVRRLVGEYAPDLIFIWGMWNLSPALAQLAEDLLPGRVVYSFAQDWPAQPDMHTAYWQTSPAHGWRNPAKRLLGKLALQRVQRERGEIHLRFEHAICVSEALRQDLIEAGIPLGDCRIIYPGIDLSVFRPTPRQKQTGQLSLLYAGNVAPHKGVHTALEALEIVVHEAERQHIHLTIAGAGHPEYKDRLQRMVESSGLQPYVTFIDWTPRAQMPDLMRKADVLLFPSIWEEPFSRVILEAMALGLVVIGAPTGGTREILKEGANGLTFPAEDASALAAQIVRLGDDPALASRLAAAAQQEVVASYGIEQMVDRIEGYLLEILERQGLVTCQGVAQ